MVKIEVFELLSAVCMYSDKGHKLVTEALTHYKVSVLHAYQCKSPQVQVEVRLER